MNPLTPLHYGLIVKSPETYESRLRRREDGRLYCVPSEACKRATGPDTQVGDSVNQAMISTDTAMRSRLILDLEQPGDFQNGFPGIFPHQTPTKKTLLSI